MRLSQSDNRWQLLPLKAINIYIIFTLFLNLSGIIVFKDYKWWLVLLFMTVVVFSINYGYRKHVFQSEYGENDYSNVDYDTLSLVKVCIVITIIIYVATFAQGLATRGISLNVILDRIIHTSDVYKDENIYNMGFFNYLIAFTGIFKTVAISGIVLYWKRMEGFRLCGIFAILIVVAYNMAFMGSMKEIGDIIVFVTISYIIQKDKNKKINKKALIIVAVCAVALFCYILYTRTLGYEYGLTRIVDKHFYKFNSENLLYKIFGQSIGYSLTMLFSYISQGYYGLSLALQSPFTFSWGIGNSFTFAAYFNSFFGTDLRLLTYPFMAEAKFGYPALEFWSTMFPWLASDYTWVGSIIVIGVVAKLFASLWDDCHKGTTILAPIFFAQLTVMWLYLPCNNQLMQTLQSTITTIVLFIAYIAKRKGIRIVFRGRR